MTVHPLAGARAPGDLLVDLDALQRAYHERTPDLGDRAQHVRFGTSGHRGSALRGTFNEAHVAAITQAICDHRIRARINGPLFLGRDTHALSEPAFTTALEVLLANRVEVTIDVDNSYTATPAISLAIVTHNRRRTVGRADGIIMTPSHNGPEDGGIKYNPPHGGPASTEVTQSIEDQANRLLSTAPQKLARGAGLSGRGAATTSTYDYVGSYAHELAAVIDLDAIRGAGIRIGVDPLGGASATIWRRLAERYGLNIEVVNDTIDPTFRFMPLDWDGRIRMDCSSPQAMAGLIALKDRFDIAVGNDPDADRHGIVTRGAGLMNPNHYLAAAIFYLFAHRPRWRRDSAIGKTMVSSSAIDRVATKLGRALVEVPVGFKWFVPGLLDGSLGFAGEESAGASFLRRDGTAWTTDKDGIVLALLAAELMAHCNRDPSEVYADLTRDLGAPVYERIDAPVSEEEKAILGLLSPSDVEATELAGERIKQMLTTAPGNGVPFGGLKVVTAEGWFAARPSGTEPVYKLYAESFRDREHLRQIQSEAQALVRNALTGMVR